MLLSNRLETDSKRPSADDIPARGDYFWEGLPRSEWGPEHEAYRE